MDGWVGCLQVEVYPIGHPIDVTCNRIGESINVSCLAICNHIDVTCKRIGDNINVKFSPIGKVLNVVCSPICSTNKGRSYWMWDAGEILLWDNKIEIDL